MHRAIILSVMAACLAAIAPPVGAQAVSPALTPPTPPKDMTLDAMPLLLAHQDLLLARSQVLELRYPDAARSLLAAGQALQTFEQLGRGPNGQDAEYTRQRIEEYAQLVETDHLDALSRIDDWLDRIGQWDTGQ